MKFSTFWFMLLLPLTLMTACSSSESKPWQAARWWPFESSSKEPSAAAGTFVLLRMEAAADDIESTPRLVRMDSRTGMTWIMQVTRPVKWVLVEDALNPPVEPEADESNSRSDETSNDSVTKQAGRFAGYTYEYWRPTGSVVSIAEDGGTLLDVDALGDVKVSMASVVDERHIIFLMRHLAMRFYNETLGTPDAQTLDDAYASSGGYSLVERLAGDTKYTFLTDDARFEFLVGSISGFTTLAITRMPGKQVG